MTNSINTNISAYYAQQNITTANTQAQSSVSRLSSGNAIVKASDNVAALATGTSLATQVNALKTAQQNVSQGSSLLQVADGALQQIQSILQQQQSIALQAGSGSLTDTDRSFLNQQFQGLSQEINSLTSSTTFNGLNLIDGSLGGASALSTNTTNSTASAVNTASVATIGSLTTSDSLTVNGVKVQFITAATAPGSAAAAGKVIIGSTVTNSAANVAAYLNGLNDPRLANLQFSNTGATIITSYSGGFLNGTVGVTTVGSTNVTGVGTQTFAATTVPDTTNATGLGVNRYSALGTVGGTLLVDGAGTAKDFGQAVDVSTLKNNAAFIGQLGTGSVGNLTGTYTATDTATFSLKVGNITYTTAATNIVNQAAPVTLTFTGSDNTGTAAGGSFKLNLKGDALGTTSSVITGQSGIDNVVSQLNTSLSNITFTQNRTVTTFQNGGTANVGGVITSSLQGASVNFVSGDTTQPQISSVSVTAPTPGTSDAKFSVIVNGDTYVSASGIGSTIAKNTVIGLQDQSDPTKTISLVTGNFANAAGTVAFDVTNQANASALQSALQQAFGLNGTTQGLTFQTGVASNDTLSVKIGAATTSSLFSGQSLDVSTQSDAVAANSTLTSAINTVTALRSNVGALETQFNFASAAIQSSQQNEDSARSALLDTDIANESTNYANEQVKLQAGISVLAQANQSLQNFLKLIQ